MSSNSTYSRKVSENLVIENGIMKGLAVPVVIDHDSFGECILDRLRANPNFVGQVDGLTGEEETFGEMTEKSVKCAMWLRQVKVEPGDVVAICTHNHLDMYVPCFASLYVGAVINAWWDAGITKEMAKCFLETGSPKVVFVSQPTASIVHKVIEEIGANVEIVIFGERPNFRSLGDVLASQDSKKVTDFRCTKLTSLEDPATIIFTSGSTGFPKGVVCSHKSIFHNAKYFMEQDNSDRVTMVFAPLAWLSGLYSLLWPAVEPNKRIVCHEFTEETFLRCVEKYKVTWVILANSSAVPLLKYPHTSRYDVSSLKTILLGGSMITEQFQTAVKNLFPGATPIQVYGSTELGGIGTKQLEHSPLSSCGVVIQNNLMKVVDTETGRTCDPLEIGEACFKFPYMMKCYYRNPEATKETIDSQGWLHTGDLVHYDEEGNVFFVDRRKELIKYRGFQVAPTMIEKMLMTRPGVREVAVVSRPHEMDGAHPLAFVSKESGAEITERDICKMVSDTFPDYMKLRGGVIFVDELPRTPSGKIVRTVLKELAKSKAS